MRNLVMATPTTQTEPPTLQTPTPDPTPAAPAAQPTTLAQILTPVQPARTAQPLGTTSVMPQDSADTSDSSSGSRGGNSSRDGNRDGVVATLVRALAGRLGRTGTATTIKRNHDVKETRVSGNSSTTANTSKADRSAKHESGGYHRSNRDAKIHDLNNKATQTHARTGRDVKKADASDTKTADAKTAKADTSAKTNRDSHNNRDAKTSNAKAAKSDTSAKSSTDDKSHGVKSAKTSDTKGPDGPSGATRTSKPNTDTAKAGGKSGEAKVDLAKAGGGKPDDPTTLGTPDKPGGPYKPDTSTAQRPRTQTSREAGYRDGHRAATAVGHVKAWRDGTRDGYQDRKDADEAERKRMDDAKARNAAKPKMTPASGSTADLAKTTAPATAPVPAQVTAIGEKAVQFAADGTQYSMSRGEVRTLKAFERRMAEKKSALGKIAETSKGTAAQAVEHATKAQTLAEDAKGVKGGAALVGVLMRLAERVQVLRARAEEIEKNAHRGVEAIAVLVINADTRHGGIYRAVVDSPLTTPAEREFYQDKQGS